MKREFRFCLSVVIVALAACTGKNVVVPVATATNQASSTNMSITVYRSDQGASSLRHPETIPANTASVDIRAWPGPSASGSPVSTGCSPFPASASSITVSASVPQGLDTVSITAYDGPCTTSSGGLGTTGTGSALTQFTGTGTVLPTSTSFSAVFAASQPVVLYPLVTTLSISVIDYFSGTPISDATTTIDGAVTAGSGGVYSPALAQGLHQLQISANAYATYNGAIQLPGGAAARTIKLFPVSPAMTAWLAQVNADRLSNGASAVQLDDMLTIAAFDHAADMTTLDYFAHFDADGFAPTTRSLLLGSMLMGAENIAEGYSTWATAEQAFMAEKSSLPNQVASDCPTYDSLAGHYCNIVWPSHNWVGLAIALKSGSYVTYDQEFGDLYGFYDPTVLGPEPPVGIQATLSFSGTGGQPVLYYNLDAMANPVPISIATLNADPECVSMCPSADQWYPPTNVSVPPAGPALQLALSNNQIYFVVMVTNVSGIFVGGSARAAFWAGGTVLPNQYASPLLNVTTQDVVRLPLGEHGRLVPNGPEMQPGSFSP